MFSQFSLCPREASVWESVYRALYCAPFNLEGPSGADAVAGAAWRGAREPRAVPSLGAARKRTRTPGIPAVLQAAPVWLKCAARNILLLIVVGTYGSQAVGFSFHWTLPFNPPLHPESTKTNFVSVFINEESEP